MRKKMFTIIIFLFSIIFCFTCNGDLLEEGAETDTAATTFLDIKLRGIWIVGGLSGDGVTNGITTTVSAVDLYDPVEAKWYPSVTTLPTPVSFAAIASANGKIYVIGGFQDNGTPAALNQIYDVASDSWSSGSITNFTAVANADGAVSDNKIYILGGTTGSAGTGWSGIANTQCYNITSDTWITGLTSYGAAGANRLAMNYNGVIYNMGGRTNVANLVGTHDGYTCSSNTLTSAAETAFTTYTTRVGMTGAVYRYSDGYLASFVIGGASAITGCATNYIFNGTLSAYTTLETVQYMYYSPSLVAWSSAASAQPYDLPQTIAFGSAAISGTTLYLFGGTSNIGAYTYPVGLPGVYALNISTRGSYGTWTTLTSMLRARFGHTAVTINQ